MISREDLESFLIRTEMEYEEIGESLWIVDPPGGTATGEPAVVLSYSPPLVVSGRRSERCPMAPRTGSSCMNNC